MDSRVGMLIQGKELVYWPILRPPDQIPASHIEALRQIGFKKGEGILTDAMFSLANTLVNSEVVKTSISLSGASLRT